MPSNNWRNVTPREKLPEPGKNILKFKKWDHLFHTPLRIYTDFESALIESYDTDGGNTTTYHNHIPIACSIKFVSDIPNLQFPLLTIMVQTRTNVW